MNTFDVQKVRRMDCMLKVQNPIYRLHATWRFKQDFQRRGRVSEGCDTLHRAAAREKLSSSHSARKYRT